MLSLLILLINRIQCPGILGLCSLQCAQQDAGECNEAQCRLGLHLHTQPILLHGDVHQRFLVWSITCVQGHCCQQAHNIKVQQMLHFVLFDLWSFRSKCWTIYICYKHSIAAGFIMTSIRVDVAYLSRFIVLFIIILINH